jgi:hypothetical protein
MLSEAVRGVVNTRLLKGDEGGLGGANARHVVDPKAAAAVRSIMRRWGRDIMIIVPAFNIGYLSMTGFYNVHFVIAHVTSQSLADGGMYILPRYY